MTTQDPIKDPKEVLVTEAGYKQLVDELEQLKTIERRSVAKRLKEAISYGDLSENSEYEEAKNQQAFVEGRILELEDKVKNAKIIRGKRGNQVQLGSKVTIKKLKSRDAEDEYTIVGSTESDPLAHKISNESPVGSALLDKSEGDTVEVEVPEGLVKYQIIKVK